jgi:hypothetical protein
MVAWFVWHSERMRKQIDPIRIGAALALLVAGGASVVLKR